MWKSSNSSAIVSSFDVDNMSSVYEVGQFNK